MKLSAIILDLLRTYPQKGTSVSTLLAAGSLFDFNENMVRVCLSRLVSKSKIENFKRGFYRLTHETNPLNAYVEEWRLGEKRRSIWDQKTWLFVYLDSGANPKNYWALSFLGFRQANDQDKNLWMRPSNLRKTVADLQALLHLIELAPSYFVVKGISADGKLEKLWLQNLDLHAINSGYRRMTELLQSSLKQLPCLDRQTAMKDSFHLGSEAINLLAKDMLLPEEIQNPSDRIQLWKTMIEYDKNGRNIWADKISTPSIMPRSQIAIV